MNGQIYQTPSGWHSRVNGSEAGPWPTRRAAVFSTIGLTVVALQDDADLPLHYDRATGNWYGGDQVSDEIADGLNGIVAVDTVTDNGDGTYTHTIEFGSREARL